MEEEEEYDILDTQDQQILFLFFSIASAESVTTVAYLSKIELCTHINIYLLKAWPTGEG